MTYLEEILHESGYHPDSRKMEQMDGYLRLLEETNRQMNLTAVRDPRDMAVKHFLDSLEIGRLARVETAGDRILDLGTGGGFPGIPLKILYPEKSFTLVDASAKKLNFIRRACAELEIEGVELIHMRAEDAGHNPGHREHYGMVLARAVAYLPVLCEYAIPLLQVGGVLAAAKILPDSHELEDSGAALKRLGAVVDRIEQYKLHNLPESRSVVCIRKIRSTDLKYPRNPAAIAKKPL